MFDYGYNHIFNELLPILKKNKKKLIVNCQSNSYNFGFNRADKYLNCEILGLDEPEFRLLLNDKTENIKKLIFKNKESLKILVLWLLQQVKMVVIFLVRGDIILYHQL